MTVKRMASMEDYEKVASKTLSRPVFDHLISMRSSEPTVASIARRGDFQRIKLKLRGMLNLKFYEGTSTKLFGQTLASPIGIIVPSLPDVGLVNKVKDVKDNESVIMNVCKDLNTLVCVPLQAGYDAALQGRTQPFLVSVIPSREFDAAKIAKLVPTTCMGVVIECGYVPDARSKVDSYNSFEMPQRLQIEAKEVGHSSFNFKMISSLKQSTHLPVIVRGIQSAEDARQAVAHGADGIWLAASTFESDPSPISILRSIRLAVTKTPVILSGGVMRGTDALKAIALGADAVFLDYEAALWGVNLDGAAGLKRMVEMVVEEFKLAMVLTHCENVSKVNVEQVVHWVSKL